MLSFAFGTDKIEYWDLLRETIAGQSNYMVLPCGHERDHVNVYKGMVAPY